MACSFVQSLCSVGGRRGRRGHSDVRILIISIMFVLFGRVVQQPQQLRVVRTPQNTCIARYTWYTSLISAQSVEQSKGQSSNYEGPTETCGAALRVMKAV